MEQQEVQYLIVIFSVTLFVAVVVILSLVNYFIKKKTQFLVEKELAATMYESNLAVAKEEIIEQNLKNISYELHDNVGQLLSVASIEAKLLLEKDGDHKEELNELSLLITKSLSEIRSLSKTLNSDVIDKLGLKKTLETELARIERLELLDVQLSYDEGINFSNDKEIIIFRMLQEFTINVLKHAEASQLRIDFKNLGDKIKITAQDNGSGFDSDDVTIGNGLTHLQRRAALINAEYDLTSIIDVGTTMRLSVPHG